VSFPVAVIALLTGIVVWALLARRLTARPWESPGAGEETEARGVFVVPPAKVGLWGLLAVVTSLFGLFIAAFHMRMEHSHGDWTELAVPKLLWLNTAFLLLSSAAMQWARSAAGRGQAASVRAGLLAGGAFAIAFIAGQLLAWQQLSHAGSYLTSGPSSSFFYVLTGVHGLHVLGGLIVWARTAARMFRPGAEVIDLRLSIELCTTYWHYLLLVWLVLFALLLSN